MHSFRQRTGTGLLVIGLCGALVGCSTPESSGWSGRVVAESNPGTLSAGDPLGRALYTAHHRRALEEQLREQRVALLFGTEAEVLVLDGETVTATAEEE